MISWFTSRHAFYILLLLLFSQFTEGCIFGWLQCFPKWHIFLQLEYLLILSDFYFSKFFLLELHFLHANIRSPVISIAYLLTSFALIEASIDYISLIILSLYSSIFVVITLKLLRNESSVTTIIILSQIL